MHKTRVVLDTNFLMIPAQFKVDIFEELKRLISVPYDACIFKATFGELEKLAATKAKDAPAARTALMLIKQKNLKTLGNSSEETGYIDRIILDNVADDDIVCTQDKLLKQNLRLKSKKIRIITLKSKKYLDFS